MQAFVISNNRTLAKMLNLIKVYCKILMKENQYLNYKKQFLLLRRIDKIIVIFFEFTVIMIFQNLISTDCFPKFWPFFPSGPFSIVSYISLIFKIYLSLDIMPTVINIQSVIIVHVLYKTKNIFSNSDIYRYTSNIYCDVNVYLYN